MERKDFTRKKNMWGDERGRDGERKGEAAEESVGAKKRGSRKHSGAPKQARRK